MNRIIFILLCFLSLTGWSQDSLGTLNGTLNAFYSALQASGPQQQAKLENLLLPEARMNAVSVNSAGAARVALGGITEFQTNAESFYSQFQVYLDEVDRTVDYYADMASVNSLLFQTVVNRKDGKRYEQELWYSIDLVYQNNRWYVAQATWTSDLRQQSLQNSISTDTLWHRIEKP